MASSIVFHSLVAPTVRFLKDDAYAQANADAFRLSERLTFQFSTPGSGGPLGLVAVILWSGLLLNGLWRLVTLDHHLRFRLVLGSMLAFEVLLHMLYGEETFVYSLNFMPLLLAVAACGALAPGRRIVTGVAAVLVVCVALNNWQQFQAATHTATQFTPQRELMTAMMEKDPERPWPRSVGHVPRPFPVRPREERPTMSQEEISARNCPVSASPSGCAMRAVRRWLSVRRYRSTRSHKNSRHPLIRRFPPSPPKRRIIRRRGRGSMRPAGNSDSRMRRTMCR